MNNLLNISTPAQNQADAFKSDFDLSHLGLIGQRKVYWNLPAEALYEEIIFRQEGCISKNGPVLVNTGKHTARAASDKYIVREYSTEEKIWWGKYNRPYNSDQFMELYGRLQGYLQGRDLFVQDCYGGADPNYRFPIRIITELAWHSLFARNMFLKPATREEYRRHIPEFTVIAAPSFKAFSQIDQTKSDTFIILNFDQRLCIIGNSSYGGEIKKSVFTLLNFLLPIEGVLTMHCSANIGKDNQSALFFGLSGTGKTTLSADPIRTLIGDDEHGWSDDGIFNFEDGCYAKVIGLSPTAEPQIYSCTNRYGTILENVIFDPITRNIDLDDDTLTENTRASYPLQFIGNAQEDRMGPHPKDIIFLTCDASGVMPPIARLTTDQAVYHFISGYTAKVGGTEIGLGDEPEITFSACFGAPFMVHPPSVYADLLSRKIERYNVKCWLLNTGWVGGPYGIGKRISIHHTRKLLNAALDGLLDAEEYYLDPIFKFKVPRHCPDVPDSVLFPANSWADEDEYLRKYISLASRFIDNFKVFARYFPDTVLQAGPKIPL
jgi:phosphoenolpyruvate carboxykinase (ATP)